MSAGTRRHNGSTRARRGSNSGEDRDSDDDHISHIEFWIPSARVDLVVLAAYLKSFVDDTATIRSATNPQDRRKQGYIIGARRTLNVAQLQDIVRDSQAWSREMTSAEYKDHPYSFGESDVAQTRKEQGATAMTRRQHPRTPRSPSAHRAPEEPSQPRARGDDRARYCCD
jgi:hypothetical protein